MIVSELTQDVSLARLLKLKAKAAGANAARTDRYCRESIPVVIFCHSMSPSYIYAL